MQEFEIKLQQMVVWGREIAVHLKRKQESTNIAHKSNYTIR